ncbi:MAG TPA: hypothetical protein P5081_18335 [Phycisphaerae bacterium]|nr:hypothetical protein [Phycisphaerae bacterium]HRW54831.1 hypothetical protein [Phycisphaerae bacterium]
MATYPTTPRSDFLEWCQAHAPVFTANAAAIGLSTEQAAAFAAATTGAGDATVKQEQAQQAGKVATQEVNEAYGDLRSEASEMVRTIRTFAENSDNPSVVYNTAQIPPPAKPTPAPPPAEPKELTVTLSPNSGDLTLQWKATNPEGTSGTSYIIRRRLPTESAFTFIGVTGTKKFIDRTLTAGPDSVQYTVQGQRADSAGPESQIFTVTFGQLPGGGMTAYVGTSAPSSAVGVRASSNGNGYANGGANGKSAGALSRMNA